MAEELSIVIGLSIISVMFAYYAFSFRQSEEEVNQKIAIIFFFFSLLFLNLVMYAILLIAQNTAGLSYLTDSVLNVGLEIITYFTVGFLIIYFIVILVASVIAAVQFVIEKTRGRQRA